MSIHLFWIISLLISSTISLKFDQREIETCQSLDDCSFSSICCFSGSCGTNQIGICLQSTDDCCGCSTERCIWCPSGYKCGLGCTNPESMTCQLINGTDSMSANTTPFSSGKKKDSYGLGSVAGVVVGLIICCVISVVCVLLIIGGVYILMKNSDGSYSGTTSSHRSSTPTMSFDEQQRIEREKEKRKQNQEWISHMMWRGETESAIARGQLPPSQGTYGL